MQLDAEPIQLSTSLKKTYRLRITSGPIPSPVVKQLFYM